MENIRTETPSVGDWAWHEFGYDPRRIAEVSEDGMIIWIEIFDLPPVPVPAQNYYFTKQRMVDR